MSYTNGKESATNNMDREIEVPPGEAKTRPSGTISNNGSGPAQLEGLFPLSHHNTEFRTLFKVRLAEYGKLPQKGERREKNRLIAEKEI